MGTWILELRCREDISLEGGASFHTEVLLPDRRSGHLGCDEYLAPGILKAGQRIAGFGRAATYPSVPRFGAFPSLPVSVDETCLAFRLDTTVILSPGLLGQWLSLQITDEDGSILKLPLSAPETVIEWKGRGQYEISLRPL